MVCRGVEEDCWYFIPCMCIRKKGKKNRVVICAFILLVIFLVTPSKHHFPWFAEAIVVFSSCYAHTQRKVAFFSVFLQCAIVYYDPV